MIITMIWAFCSDGSAGKRALKRTHGDLRTSVGNKLPHVDRRKVRNIPPPRPPPPTPTGARSPNCTASCCATSRPRCTRRPGPSRSRWRRTNSRPGHPQRRRPPPPADPLGRPARSRADLLPPSAAPATPSPPTAPPWNSTPGPASRPSSNASCSRSPLTDHEPGGLAGAFCRRSAQWCPAESRAAAGQALGLCWKVRNLRRAGLCRLRG